MSSTVNITAPIVINRFGALDLPENSEIHGDLDFSGCKNLKELPNGLSVRTLKLCGSGVVKLPSQLTVTQYLDITDTEISTIPSGVTVGKAIFYTLTKGSRSHRFSYTPFNGCLKRVSDELQRK